MSTQKGNCWAPAIVAQKDVPKSAGGIALGKVAVVWDTYDKGDYDVWVREFFGTRIETASTMPRRVFRNGRLVNGASTMTGDGAAR